MDQGPDTSTRILIHQAQVLPKIQLPMINLKRTQYALNNHMTTSTLWTIPIDENRLLDAREEHIREDTEEEEIFYDVN